MFEVYLPVVEIQINVIYLFLISTIIGFFSGMLGIGGGFLLTPSLILFGIPPVHAIANGANNILASSVSGTVTYWYRNLVDFKIGLYLLTGGLIGAITGTFIFKFLISQGIVDTMVSFLYFILLTSFGLIMFIESFIELRRIKQNKFIRRKLHRHYWLHGLPFKIRMHASMLYISIIPLLFFGFIIGIISSLIGVGGAFILVPVMIYVFDMPSKLVPGTSLFVMIFVMIFTTIFHAITNHNIDLILVFILILGSVIGVQLGTRVGINMRNEDLRLLMSLVIILFGLKFGYSTFVEEISVKLFKKTDVSKDLNILQSYIDYFAAHNSFIYAIVAVAVAIIFGLLGAYLSRKISN